MSDEIKDETQNEQSNSEEVLAEEQAALNEFDILQQELKDMQEKYARVHADFENIKKRLEREKITALEYANEKFAKDLVPVLDSLEGALNSVSSDVNKEEFFDKLKEGVELTYKQLLSSLEKNGITKVSHDEPFDPNIHNAIQSVDSDSVASGEIVQTFQTGYRYKERPLREAMVVVAN
ncbi:MAG: nucleotide exchange factor GrpE [Sulfurimonas sp.]|nr:nucleotide exchange factor GrpE [Sulfurimonadaceae bacterium]